MERTEGVGSSARRFLSPATADGTMSSPAGELALVTAEEMPNVAAMAMNVVAALMSPTMTGAVARCTAASGCMWPANAVEIMLLEGEQQHRISRARMLRGQVAEIPCIIVLMRECCRDLIIHS